MSKAFVISDLHFGHLSIATRRGFLTAEEHDEAVIEGWNSVVRKNDVVWVLGDLSLGDIKEFHKLRRLVGSKNLILGNHDPVKNMSAYDPYFNKVLPLKEYQGLLMTHYPVHPSQLNRYSLNIHGHTHDKVFRDTRYKNVCAEVLDYVPTSLTEIVKKAERYKNRILVRKQRNYFTEEELGEAIIMETNENN